MTTLILYIVLNGQMTISRIPYQDMQSCQQAAKQLSTPNVVFAECKAKKEKK